MVKRIVVVVDVSNFEWNLTRVCWRLVELMIGMHPGLEVVPASRRAGADGRNGNPAGATRWVAPCLSFGFVAKVSFVQVVVSSAHFRAGRHWA